MACSVRFWSRDCAMHGVGPTLRSRIAPLSGLIGAIAMVPWYFHGVGERGIALEALVD
jgi:hypothetical protein